MIRDRLGRFTAIVVRPVPALGLEPGGAVRAVPAGRALAGPDPVEIRPAVAVLGAAARAAFYRAVASVPASHTQTRPEQRSAPQCSAKGSGHPPVLALSMVAAARVAGPVRAARPRPARTTYAAAVLTSAVRPAVQLAHGHLHTNQGCTGLSFTISKLFPSCRHFQLSQTNTVS